MNFFGPRSNSTRSSHPRFKTENENRPTSSDDAQGQGVPLYPCRPAEYASAVPAPQIGRISRKSIDSNTTVGGNSLISCQSPLTPIDSEVKRVAVAQPHGQAKVPKTLSELHPVPRTLSRNLSLDKETVKELPHIPNVPQYELSGIREPVTPVPAEVGHPAMDSAAVGEGSLDDRMGDNHQQEYFSHSFVVQGGEGDNPTTLAQSNPSLKQEKKQPVIPKKQNWSKMKSLRNDSRPPGLFSMNQHQGTSYFTPDDYRALKDFCRMLEIPGEKRQIPRVLSVATTQLHEARAQIARLKASLDEKDQMWRQSEKRLAESQDKVQRIKKAFFEEKSKHDLEMKQQRDSWEVDRARQDDEINRLQDKMVELSKRHDKDLDHINSMRKWHHQEMEDLQLTYKAKLGHQETHYKEKVKGYEEKVKEAENKFNSLRRRLSMPVSMATDGYTPISDDRFRSSFQQLAQRISNLVGLVSRPDPSRLSYEADPTQFLAREAAQGRTRGWPKFVRGVCWAVLVRGFFSCPSGLGAFGQAGSSGDASPNHLIELLNLAQYGDGEQEGGMNEGSTNENNASDRNRIDGARAEIFGGLLAGMRSGTDSNSYVRAIRANVRVVGGELLAALQGVSSAEPEASAEGELLEISEAAALLALEMGSQRAQWTLETCETGHTFAVGDRFRDADCTCGAARAMVEFMTLPCLVRVGDGRRDATARVIVQGEFVHVA